MLNIGVHTLAYFHKDCNKKDCYDKKDMSQLKKIVIIMLNKYDNDKWECQWKWGW